MIVAYQNQIVMEETLELALERIFRGRAPDGPAAGALHPPAVPAPARADRRSGRGRRPAELAAQARDHYERALQAQREGDWARYGEEIKKLGEVLEQMRAASSPPPSPTTPVQR